MSVDDFTPEIIEKFIKAVEEDEEWILHDIWNDRLGPEVYSHIHRNTTTRTWKKPGTLRKEGAISALRFILRKMELSDEVIA